MNAVELQKQWIDLTIQYGTGTVQYGTVRYRTVPARTNAIINYNPTINIERISQYKED